MESHNGVNGSSQEEEYNDTVKHIYSVTMESPDKNDVNEGVSAPKINASRSRQKTSLNQGETSEVDDFCWKKFLMANPNHGMQAVPVWTFSNTPLKAIWDQLEVKDLKVEYQVDENLSTATEVFEKVFWFGTIKSYFGYFTKIKDEGYPKSKPDADVPHLWLNYLTEIYRIGHCTQLDNSAFIPPPQIMKYERDLRETILNRLANNLTIHPIVAETFEKENNSRFTPGTALEIMDHTSFSQMKQGIVLEGKGTRIFVRYWDAIGPAMSSASGVWVDMKSNWLAPRGWSKTVGLPISAAESYNPKALSEDFLQDDKGIDIQIGMKLEAIYPLNPSYISAATVVKVFNSGYMMLTFDGDFEDTDTDITESVENDAGKVPKVCCYHVTSPSIFYCGFCEESGIELVPPTGQPAQAFKWDKYFEETGSEPLPIKKAREYNLKHGFAPGKKLEAVDPTSSTAIRVASVAAVKGRLLRIHFEGSNEDRGDQWVDAESPDIYPVGWCDTFSYKLSGPEPDSVFWKKYKHPSVFKPVEMMNRRRGNMNIQLPNVDVPKTGIKRKIADTIENAVYNSDVMKAEAVKLGTKPKVLRKSDLNELRRAKKKND